MLFPSSLMHSRAATKMELIGLEIAGTLQLHFFFVRILIFIIFALSPTGMFYGAVLLLFIPLVIAIIIMQPYKPRFSTHNAVDSVLVLLLALLCATIVCINIAGLKAHKWLMFSISLAFIVAVLPLFYIFVVTLHWMCSQRPFGQRMIGRVHGWITENHRQMGCSEESLPNRLIKPEEYDENLTDPEAVEVETT